MVAEKAGNQVRLTSRNGLDHTKRFPELVKAVEGLDARSLVLDGEIAIFDSQLISRFEWLRARPKHDVSTPPIYMVFDLLELGGENLRTRPLQERRQALEQLAADRQLIMPTRRLPANGLEAWWEVLRGNYEGMVVHGRSPYCLPPGAQLLEPPRTLRTSPMAGQIGQTPIGLPVDSLALPDGVEWRATEQSHLLDPSPSGD